MQNAAIVHRATFAFLNLLNLQNIKFFPFFVFSLRVKQNKMQCNIFLGQKISVKVDRVWEKGEQLFTTHPGTILSNI